MSSSKDEREFLAPASADGVKIQIKPFDAAVRSGSSSGLGMEDFKTFAWMALNVVSSIGIVATNKWVFTTDKFNFGTVLTIIHFVVTTIGLEILARIGFFEKKSLSIPAVLPLSIAFSGFVVLTNLSLQFNSVGFCG